jgi:hypothetical protein
LSVIICCHTDSALCLSLGAGISKGLADHLDKRSFVNSYVLAAGTLYLVISGCKGIFFDNPCFMATENFSGAYFVVFPQLAFAGGAS